jgi:uncharacterized OB-fold protein
MPEYNKPIPFPDPFTSKPYWDGAKERKLMLPRCTSCSRVHFYPRVICPNCGRRTIEWFEASGEGYLYSFAVQHRAAGAWAEEAPFVTAYIDLEEGDRIFTVLRGVDPNQPQEIFKLIGAKCRIEWDEANEQVNMPYWRVVGNEGGGSAK